MSPNAGVGGGLRGLSQCVHPYTWSRNKLWRSYSTFKLWILCFSPEYHNSRQNIIFLFWKYLLYIESEAWLNHFGNTKMENCFCRADNWCVQYYTMTMPWCAVWELPGYNSALTWCVPWSPSCRKKMSNSVQCTRVQFSKVRARTLPWQQHLRTRIGYKTPSLTEENLRGVLFKPSINPTSETEPVFVNVNGAQESIPRNRFREIDSASLCSLAGRYYE